MSRRGQHGGRAGFTLLEALAAVMMLGVLAVAVVPMLRQLGRADLPERLQAQSWLATLDPGADPIAWHGRSVPGHPGWRLRVSELVAEAEPAPPPGSAPPAGPAHRWVLIAVCVDGSGEALAETLVAMIAPEARR